MKYTGDCQGTEKIFILKESYKVLPENSGLTLNLALSKKILSFTPLIKKLMGKESFTESKSVETLISLILNGLIFFFNGLPFFVFLIAFVKTVNDIIFEKEIKVQKLYKEQRLQDKLEHYSKQALEYNQPFESGTDENGKSILRIDKDGIYHANYGLFEWKNIENVAFNKRVVDGNKFCFLLVIAKLPSPYIDDIDNEFGERKEFYLNKLDEETIKTAVDVAKVFSIRLRQEILRNSR